MTIPVLLILPAAVSHREYVAAWFKQLPTPPLHDSNITWINEDNEGLKVETVRETLGQLAYSAYLNQPRWLAFLNFETASVVIQNTLLKTLEEPPAQTYFVLSVTHLSNILPTIQSRCQIQYWSGPELALPVEGAAPAGEASAKVDPAELYQQILTSSEGQIMDLTDAYSDRDEALQVLQQLLTYLHTQNQSQPSAQLTEALRSILEGMAQLQYNVHVKLVMGETFLKVKGLKG